MTHDQLKLRFIDLFLRDAELRELPVDPAFLLRQVDRNTSDLWDSIHNFERMPIPPHILMGALQD